MEIRLYFTNDFVNMRITLKFLNQTNFKFFICSFSLFFIIVLFQLVLTYPLFFCCYIFINVPTIHVSGLVAMSAVCMLWQCERASCPERNPTSVKVSGRNASYVSWITHRAFSAPCVTRRCEQLTEYLFLCLLLF